MLIDRRTFAAGLLLSGCASPPRASGDQASLEAAVAGVRARFGLVSLAAYVSLNGATLAETAQGARVLGRPTPVTTRDLWHIGSCFKAQTATLLARLIQAGAAAWETTLPDIFPERAHAMHPDARRMRFGISSPAPRVCLKIRRSGKARKSRLRM
ncbi:MAG: serine hydrolase [Hyphomonadaceae bacterium]